MTSSSGNRYAILLHPALEAEDGGILRDHKGAPKTKRLRRNDDGVDSRATVDRKAGILAFPMEEDRWAASHDVQNAYFVDLAMLQGQSPKIPIHRALRDEDGFIVCDTQGRPYVRPPQGAQLFASLNRDAGVLEIPTGPLTEFFWRREYGRVPVTYFVHLGQIRRPCSSTYLGVLEEPGVPGRKPDLPTCTLGS